MTFAEGDCKYYEITKKDVAFLIEHCATCVMTRSAQTAAPLEAIVVKEPWEDQCS